MDSLLATRPLWKCSSKWSRVVTSKCLPKRRCFSLLPERFSGTISFQAFLSTLLRWNAWESRGALNFEYHLMKAPIKLNTLRIKLWVDGFFITYPGPSHVRLFSVSIYLHHQKIAMHEGSQIKCFHGIWYSSPRMILKYWTKDQEE